MQHLTDTANKIQIQTKIDHCENKINEIVYQLYNLTEEEIKIVEVKWEAGKNPTGLYFYKIIATDINNPNNKLIQTKKMMLVK